MFSHEPAKLIPFSPVAPHVDAAQNLALVA